VQAVLVDTVIQQSHLRKGVAPSSGISSPRFLTIASPVGVMMSLDTATICVGLAIEEEANVKADARPVAT